MEWRYQGLALGIKPIGSTSITADHCCQLCAGTAAGTAAAAAAAAAGAAVGFEGQSKLLPPVMVRQPLFMAAVLGGVRAGAAGLLGIAGVVLGVAIEMSCVCV